MLRGNLEPLKGCPSGVAPTSLEFSKNQWSNHTEMKMKINTSTLKSAQTCAFYPRPQSHAKL